MRHSPKNARRARLKLLHLDVVVLRRHGCWSACRSGLIVRPGEFAKPLPILKRSERFDSEQSDTLLIVEKIVKSSATRMNRTAYRLMLASSATKLARPAASPPKRAPSRSLAEQAEAGQLLRNTLVAASVSEKIAANWQSGSFHRDPRRARCSRRASTMLQRNEISRSWNETPGTKAPGTRTVGTSR